MFIMHPHNKSEAATLEGLAYKIGFRLASGNLAGKQLLERIQNITRVPRLFYPLEVLNTCFVNGNLELQ